MWGASRTAEVVGMMRLLESQRPDAVLTDTEVAAFLGRSFRAGARLGRVLPWFDGVRGSGLTNYVVTRHVYMDRELQAAKVPEVLVLGAGYDTRAVRIGGSRFWEVDHPATAARKRRLRPDHPAVRVDVDFQRQRLEERMVGAGFPVGARTFVIWEGVTMYLSREAIAGTLQVLASLLGPGSVLVLDALRYPEGRSLRAYGQRLSAALMPLIGEPVTFMAPPDDLSGLLATQGWVVDEVLDAEQLAGSFAPGRFVLPLAYTARAVLKT